MIDDPLSLAFGALAHPSRRAIIAQLAEGEATVNELAAPLALSLPSVSKHLKVLQHAGLVIQRRDQQRRPCRIVSEPLQEVRQWVDRYAGELEEAFVRLDALLASQTKEGGTSDGQS